MKIVQFGLAHSPNVGDGVIAECLLHGIRLCRPEARVQTVDISGRAAPGDRPVPARGVALRLLPLLPPPVRRALVRRRLTRLLDRVEPQWQSALAGADLAVVGGGQLFSDADLNFCLKLARVAALLRGAGVPVAVHAAGASRNWSVQGTALFMELLGTDLRRVGLRDAASLAAWRDQTGGAPPAPVLARDPGLLAARLYPPAPPTGRVAICVTAPQILRYHADADADADAAVAARGLDFYARLADRLLYAGERVTLFCNGAWEDRQALARLAGGGQLSGAVAAGCVQVAPPPGTPADLAAIVSGARAVVAHRLHACILAHAYAVPAVGLGWDRKVESFFAAVGQGDRFMPGPFHAPDDVARSLGMAAAAGGDRAAAEAEADAALNDIRLMLAENWAPARGAA